MALSKLQILAKEPREFKVEETNLAICGGPTATDLGRASTQIESWKNLSFRVVGGILQFEKSRWVVVHLDQVKQRNPHRYPFGEWGCEGVVTRGEFEAKGISQAPSVRIRVWYVDSKNIGSVYLLTEPAKV